MAAKEAARSKKDKHVQIRISETQKQLLEKAAERAGLSLSSFMLTVALSAAKTGWLPAVGPVAHTSSGRSAGKLVPSR
jgi:hypothetical protein